ncbi:MAG: HAMP domain-containing protein [Deltaproteobacteria bacterium]|nr:HAMP domain-containing protein [Deltaproteobacteria bacterium]
MKGSVTARVAYGLTGQLVVFGAAVVYLVWSADSMFDDISVLKDDLEPATVDLRNLAFELKSFEEMLSAPSDGGLGRVADYMPRARVFDRLRSDSVALRKVARWKGTRAEVRANLDGAAKVLENLVLGDRLVSGVKEVRVLGNFTQPPKNNRDLLRRLLERLNSSLGYRHEEDARLIARELLRVVRITRAAVMRTSRQVLSASRDANDALFRKRSEMSYTVLLVPAGALALAIVVTLLTLRTLRPIRELAMGVRRLALGDYDVSNPPGLTGELKDLAEALDSLARALKARDSDLERKKDELMRAERLALVGRMASVVAHEVRNPLNSIALNVDLLSEMVKSGEKGDENQVEDVLSAVQREVDRLAEITEEYLKFGRLPKGVLAPCDLGRVVNETRLFMEGEFSGAGVVVDVRTPDKPLMVVVDEAQLRQALLNLLRNAVEAMPEGGTITVEAGGRGERAVLSVRDTGPGIPEEFRPRLFEPFATTKQRGTGLGLAFVQQVAHECGGEVVIDSEVGVGTTVRLFLKRAL